MLKSLWYFSLISCFSMPSFAVEVQNTLTASTDPKTNKIKVVQPFIATYSILHKSDPVGKAIRELVYLTDGTLKYSYQTHIKWFIYSDAREETSFIKLNKNTVIPQHYVFDRTSTTRDKSYEWLYDADNNSAKNLKKNKDFTFDFSKNFQDPLSYHFQHRLNLIQASKNNSLKGQTFSYPVIKTSGSTKDYIYQYDGEEELMLPYGLVKAVKFKREVPEKKRVTYAWFAPELNFLMVKLYQVKGGTEQFEAQLTAVSTQTNTPSKHK